MVRQHHFKRFLIYGSLLAAIYAGDAWAAEEKKNARQLFKTGVNLFRDGKFEEAAASFDKAYKLKPTYKLLFNIGQARAATKQYDLAIQAFERYLVDGGDDLTEDRRDAVLKEIAKLRPLVGFLEVEARPGLLIRVDGIERGRTPLKSKIMLTVGHSHQVEVLDGDEVVFERELSVYGGMVESISVKKPVEDKPMPQSVIQEPEEKPEGEPIADEKVDEPVNKKKLWGWLTLSLGAAVLGGGGVLGGLALSQDGTLSDACPGGSCSPTRQGEIDAMDRMALISDIMFGVGGALAATGLILLVLPDKGKKEKADDPNAPDVSVTPTPGGIFADVRF